ncbi:MAG TPA: YchJ family metal-binding protein [Methylophilaceae bacterium]|jgi:SEC-C motif-containing protein
MQYEQCCQRYHAGNPAPTALELMRSRYSAYALGLEAYLLATWHISTCPTSLALANDNHIKWVSLLVKEYKLLTENTASVEFIARYKVNGKAESLHEISLFEKNNGYWFYIRGDFQS